MAFHIRSVIVEFTLVRSRFACPECDKKFKQSGELISHLRFHTGAKAVCLSRVLQEVQKSGELISHRRVHIGEKPFVCPECDKKFKQSGELISHLRLHTGEKPFVCPECDKKLISSPGTVAHHPGHNPVPRETIRRKIEIIIKFNFFTDIFEKLIKLN